ncbi:MAG TPA: 4a-hydroxytetrahydrobiopterin dehydratase, partial [Paracoccus sp. (in: a-proteobacteria)]|nr:4a-hydroxytetrahydrobiopterin dehydratase [Paracoccus sp. (in: a-proteobacteria)]
MTGLAGGKITDGAPALASDALAAQLTALPGWDLAADGKSISREWRFKTFRRAAQL